MRKRKKNAKRDSFDTCLITLESNSVLKQRYMQSSQLWQHSVSTDISKPDKCRIACDG